MKIKKWIDKITVMVAGCGVKDYTDRVGVMLVVVVVGGYLRLC